jgi:hypothetical protein
MKSSRQAGALNVLIIPVVLLSVALLGVGAYAYVAAAQASDYKNNVDQKVDVAVEKNSAEVSAQKDKDFAEKEKYPYTSYTGTDATGNLKIVYPKTWSGYVVAPETQSSPKPLDSWFQPGQVPSTSNVNNSYALRVTVEQSSYDTAVKSYQSKQKSGAVTIQPYQAVNVPSLIGVRIDGEVKPKKQGSMVILPFRDKTLTMWTESTDYRDDFNNIILPNFTLNP